MSPGASASRIRSARVPGPHLRGSLPASVRSNCRVPAEVPTFARDIRPLFRQGDVESMSFAFDLSSYEDVRRYAEEIYERVADGSMPCDEEWPRERVAVLRRWIDADSPP
jgi:hypothetical protein